MDILIHVGTIILFLVLGIVFRAGKASFLIAGYNTASPDEKSNTDEKKLCRAVGNLCLILALCWIVPSVGMMTGKMWLFWTGLTMFVFVCIAGVIYMNTGNRFKR